MTLSFPNPSRAYDETRKAVRFWGYDQSMEASFFVSAKALQLLKPGTSDSGTALLDVFDSNRPRILEAAVKIYGRGRNGGFYQLGPSDF